MKRFLIINGLAFMLLNFAACKKCYICEKANKPDIEICGKGLIGKATVEADRSNLAAEGYYCR